jgi:hypothetical protein
VINQGGVLRAPLGVINLGAGSGAPVDPLSGQSVPMTSTLNLQPGSITSVSAIDSTMGQVTIPFGITVNGNSWIDPSGTDITNSGPASKNITLTAGAINFQPAAAGQLAASIDMRGGGDLSAYQFVPGTGGTNDILSATATANSGAFAIVPTFSNVVAPFAAYATGATALNLASDTGYTNTTAIGASKKGYQAGDQIYLAGGGGLAAGDYTLLPARYALLPGAYLVTPLTSTATAGAAAGVANPDGSTVMAGYLFNGLDQAGGGSTQSVFNSFQVASQSVVLQRAQYNVTTANTFFTNQATTNNTIAPRLPVDAGQLVMEAGSSLSLQGTILAGAPAGGRGGLIDISSPSDILIGSESVIASSEATNPDSGTVFLDAAELSSFGAESLLIGGLRATGTGATQVNVTTGNLTVNNSGEALTGTDIILVANNSLTVMAGSAVSSTGTLASPVDSLNIAGDGVLLRVSSDPTAQISRSVLTSSTSPNLTIDPGASIGSKTTGSVILDSTNAMSISNASGTATAAITGQSLTFDSGQITLQLDNAGNPPATTGLLLTKSGLQGMLTNTQSLSLLSYSTLDLYGSGSVGGFDSTGQPVLGSLGLHAGAIRGYSNSSDPAIGITLAARNITLDNSANDGATAPAGAPAGALTFDAATIELGSNQLEIQNYATVSLDASNGVLTGSTAKFGAKNGGLSVIGGDLTIDTPLVTGAVATMQSISADGKLSLLPASGTATVVPGLGADLNLIGGSVEIDDTVKMPSGTLTVEATAPASSATGDLIISGGTLDVGGTGQQFFDVTKYTDGGRITLTADNGNLRIGSGSTISVAAQNAGGDAGTLTLSATNGSLSVDPSAGLLARLPGAGAAGLGGRFNLDTLKLTTPGSAVSYLGTLEAALAAGGFDQSVALRVRSGDVVADGTIRSHDFSIEADSGTITVSGVIDASGFIGSTSKNPMGGVMNAADPTGGTIALNASGSVVLTPDAWLTAAGYCYNNASQGGAITLSAGNYTAGQVNTAANVVIPPNATVSLGVKNQFTTEDMALNPTNTPIDTNSGLPADGTGGTLHLRESQTAFGTGSQFNTLSASVKGASNVVLEGFQVFDLTGTNGAVSTAGAITTIGTGGLVTSAVENAVQASGAAFIGSIDTALANNALLKVQPGAEIVNTTSVNGGVTNQFLVFNSSGSAANEYLSVPVKVGSPVTLALVGSMPTGDIVRFSTPGLTGKTFTVTAQYADGSSAIFNSNANIPAVSASTGSAIVSFSFNNKGTKTANGQLAFFSGTTPFVVALGSPFTSPAVSAPDVPSYVGHSGDIILANNWDLSTYRFGPSNQPGNLVLRASGNLVFGFDASLSDGFASTNNPLWSAPLIAANPVTGSDHSWSYQLVAGADYTAANPLAVQPLGTLVANSGSILVGQGGVALPTATGSNVTSASIVPQYYQTIRTGTGNITLSAGYDVQLLNPLATIYTAGTQAAPLPGFARPNLNLLGATTYPASFSQNGGNVTIQVQDDIVRYLQNSSGNLIAASSLELPNNWLYRQGLVGSNGDFAALTNNNAGGTSFITPIQSTSWWVDFSNFFDDVGALGGGNITLAAGHNVTNVNASVATNARMPGSDAAGNPIAPNTAALLELGGGDLSVQAGANVDGGVYYAERGDATLNAGGNILTNSTRSVFGAGSNTSNSVQWLPTTFFLGEGSINVTANGDILLGPVANPFLLPQSANNTDYERTFFSTYALSNSVNVTSFGGTITVQDSTDSNGPLITSWYLNVLGGTFEGYGTSQPWLRALDFGGDPSIVDPFNDVATLMPATFRATAFSNDINIVGSATLAPSPTGTLDLLTSGNINGLAVNGASAQLLSWGTAAINLSDAALTSLPSIGAPLAFEQYTTSTGNGIVAQVGSLLNPINLALSESGSTDLTLEEKLARHGTILDAAGNLEPLHYGDNNPVHLYAVGGDISGLTLYSAKSAKIVAGQDITDIAFYIQNNQSTDVTLVAASHDIVAYDPNTPQRAAAQQPGNILNVGLAGETAVASADPDAGDLQIAGPGSLEVLAGRNLDLGSGSNTSTNGTAAGITSVGSIRNPFLPQDSGAGIVAAAGVGSVYTPVAATLSLTPGLASTGLGFASFINDFLNPDSAGTEAIRYLPDLATMMGIISTDPVQIWAAFGTESKEQQAIQAQDIFELVLRDSGRDRNNPDSPNFGTYADGFAAIVALFPGSPQPSAADLKSTVPVAMPAGSWNGELSMPTREIKTFEGGDISLLVPRGDITVGRATDPQTPDQGVLTERGGNISIFAANNVDVGTSRIFTLLGGNEIVWSTWGNVAAGSGSKTVFSAPPTRVLIDPQSGDVQNDLAGLATGSGIGVLATLAGVNPGDVDLIAPVGTIDAGDAGIRASGNLNLAARVVLNASNIQVSGVSVGTPPPPSAPNLAPLTAASTASAAATSTAADVTRQETAATQTQITAAPSIITVEVLGYGGENENSTEGDSPQS